jgi:hypothetical protein
MKNSVLRIACSFAVAAGVTGQASATDSRNFNVTFKDCTEFVGVTPVNRKKADALVPERFTVAGLSPRSDTSSIVVRVSNCKSVSVDGRPGKRGTVAHIGINIASPDLTPPPAQNVINNYTIAYASDNEELVAKLQRAGVPAEFDRNLAYEFTPPHAQDGELYAAITTDRTPHWFVHGTTAGKLFETPFFANWWRSGHGYETKMATTIDPISFFNASGVSFFTARSNLVGKLIGGNKITTFTELQVRGVFDLAEMRVTVQD